MSYRNRVPVPVLKTADKLRRAYWHAIDARLFGAGVALHDQNKDSLLLVQQSYGDPDMWSFPGGGLTKKADRENEKLLGGIGIPYNLRCYEDTAIKELKDEVGIKLSDPRISELSKLAVSVSYLGPGVDTYVVFIAKATDLTCLARESRPRASSEIADVQEIPISELSSLTLHHAVKKSIAEIRV